MPEPKQIGKYEILEEIGRGGFAVVYKARDPDLDRPVALKVLAPHLTWDPTFAERFRREAQATARLRHPNIVTVYEVGQAGDQLYIAMAYLPGHTLAELLKVEGAMPLDRALPILAQVAEALDDAHSQGAIHRDVKPSNVMVEDTARGPRATLMDFGLVKAMESSESLTSAGTILGSPEYMAPEQADPDRKSEIGPATDRYALGVVAYEMLTGQVPFPGSTPSTLVAHMQKAPPDPRSVRRDLPEGTAQVLLKALFKSPRGRYPTATAMVEALHRAQTLATREAEAVERKAREARERQRARAVAEKEVEQRRPPAIQPRRKRFPAWGWVAAGALILAVVGTGVGLIWLIRGKTTMVYVPASKFWMGSEDSDTWTHDNEKPKHEVYLDAFWIDRTEVTNAQYRRCVDDGVCSPPSQFKSYARDSYYGNPDFDDYPAIYLTWHQAEAYCHWAGKRLPTEAEWEKAARGTDRRIYPWGNDFDGSWLNFCDVNCGRGWKDESWDDGYTDTAPVGSYPEGKSPFGALDMAGNVWEWTSSLYKPYPYDEEDGREDPAADGSRVVRGGSWLNHWRYVRAAYRYGHVPSFAQAYLSFRCARSGSGP